MPLSEELLQAERTRIAQMVLDLVKERGAEITYSGALAESGRKCLLGRYAPAYLILH